jgi:hypothetical protein
MAIQASSQSTYLGANQDSTGPIHCPLSGALLQEKINACFRVNLPYIIAFARVDSNQAPVVLDGVNCLSYHIAHPGLLFTKAGFTKIHFYALNVLMPQTRPLPHIGTLSCTENPNDFLVHYIFATCMQRGALAHMEQLVANYEEQIGKRALFQFAATLLWNDPHELLPRTKLLRYINHAPWQALAQTQGPIIVLLAIKNHDFELFSSLCEKLLPLCHQIPEVKNMIVTALFKWNTAYPGNPTVLSLIGILLPPQSFPLAHNCFVRAIEEAPHIPLPYFLLAKLHFEHLGDKLCDLALAKSSLHTFIRQGIYPWLPMEVQRERAHQACELIREYVPCMNKNELLEYTKAILAKLPDCEEAHYLMVDHQSSQGK